MWKTNNASTTIFKCYFPQPSSAYLGNSYSEGKTSARSVLVMIALLVLLMQTNLSCPEDPHGAAVGYWAHSPTVQAFTWCSGWGLLCAPASVLATPELLCLNVLHQCPQIWKYPLTKALWWLHPEVMVEVLFGFISTLQRTKSPFRGSAAVVIP